ncbi:AGE family epimerase/isomerase [Peribacillus muralis]|uniref:AGE family epimerase/isomerase n=1 Tax=Peribacillus muralis TaxID=264697 RepID=UPI00366B07C1
MSEQITEHLEELILPFWNKSLDTKYGGVFTCYNNEGSKLISKDKFTWSQGRFLWAESKLITLIKEKRIKGNLNLHEKHAQQTYTFLTKNAFLDNGNCAFLLSESGKMKESQPDSGFDTSIFADCFVVLGFAEYAKITNRIDIFNQAVNIYKHIKSRILAGTAQSEPYPILTGYTAHSFPMIMLNVSQELAETAELLNSSLYSELLNDSSVYMHTIFEDYRLENGRIIEMNTENEELKNTLLHRHLNPGHAIECMWFVMKTANKNKDYHLIEKAVDTVLYSLEMGWDKHYQGLYRFVDFEGGKPKGKKLGGSFENLIEETWDTKLWWPHSEALYCTLLGYKLTNRPQLMNWFEIIKEYTFKTFPNEDTSIGEWIQIRSRYGEPVNRLVALPVKDPYHITRNFFLMLDLLL